MGLLVPRAGTRRALAVSTVVTAALAAAALAPSTSAHSSLSPGCEGENHDLPLDGQYAQGGWILPRTFDAGDRLKVTADQPTKLGTPSSITLEINGVTVDTQKFPGVFTYTFTQDGGYTAWWSTVGGVSGGGNADATWSVSCSHPVGSGSPPPPPPTRKRQCKDGRWKNYGSTFKNKRQCLRYVERHRH